MEPEMEPHDLRRSVTRAPHSDRPAAGSRLQPPLVVARNVTWEAIGLGILADLLLRAVPWGANLTLWLAAASVAALGVIVRFDILRRRLEAWPLLLVLLGGAGIVWRDSELLGVLYLGLVAIGGALILVQAGHGAAAGARVWEFIGAGARAARGAVVGLVPVVPVVWAARPEGASRDGRLATLTRGALLGVPLLLVFGSLFASADPLFERYVRQAFSWDPGELVGHVALAAFLAWVSGGLLHELWSAPLRPPMPTVGRPKRSAGEVLMALALLDLLFLAFIAVQARYLFGGRELVEDTLGLTYSAYARRGFFQLVTAAALVLPTLVVSEWVMRDVNSRLRRRFGRLTLVLLVGVGVVLISAVGRMVLYSRVYGLTELRVFTTVFMVWLAFVFVWFWRTVLRGSGQGFVTGALAAGVLIASGLTVANPDAWIVRVNSRRIASDVRMSHGAIRPETGFDVEHASSLGADAVPALLAVVPRLDLPDRCVLAEILLQRWVEPTPPDWRSWNWSRWMARRAATEQADDLRQAVTRCPEPELSANGSR